MMQEYYNRLGLEPDADEKSIKQAYRQKALLYHPDRNTSPEATRLFIMMTEAYEYLTHHQKKTINPFEEQMRNYQQKAERMAQMDFEAFQNECEAFQSSPYYFPGVVAMFLAGVVYLLAAAFLICLPVIIAVKSHTWWYSIALIPLALAGVYLYVNISKEQSFWRQYLRK
jgi:VIT1/CCC1 family predicted Fe2+/Mn2+ transporter